MKRRDFLKGMAVTGAAASVGGGLGILRKAHARQKVDIGQIKGLTVEVLSETSWFDNAIFKKNIMDYGGSMTNQYTIPWDWDNAGGYMTKITVEPLEGEPKVFLMDTGWNNGWVDYIYDEKSDMGKLLTSGKVDTMILSHWHLDHYWGIESTLKRNPKITMYAPKTYFPEDMKLLKGGKNVATTKDGKEVVINQEQRAAPGQAGPHRPQRREGRDHLPPHGRCGGQDVRRADSAQGARRKRDVLQRKGQGRSHRDRLLPPRHSDPERLGPAQCGGLPALRLLRWPAHQPVRNLGPQVRRHHQGREGLQA
jgi:hypothetical protein